MGIFANSPRCGLSGDLEDFTGMWIGPRPEAQAGLEGFAAMGQVVPFDRRAEGYVHLKAMGFTDKEKMFRVVELLADRIERDDPHGGMEEMYKMGLDVTGIYRLLAVMLHSPPKHDPSPPEPASYLDLVES